MWRNIALVLVCLLVAVCCFEYSHAAKAHVSRVLAANPGAEPSIFAVLDQYVASLGGYAAVIGALAAWFHKFTDSMPAGPKKRLVVSVVDIGEISELAHLYGNATNQVERDSLKAGAKARLDDLFAEWFPAESPKS